MHRLPLTARLVPSALALALALAVGAMPTPALAQNASEQAEARTLFDEAVRLYAAGQYPEACSKLEASYHLYAGIGTRGKLAECYEKVGRTASAWAMYQEVVVLAGRAGDATREKVARDRAAALEPKLSHLTVVLPPASDAPGLVVKRGTETMERGAFGSPVPVDPGTITFEVSATGRVTKKVDLSVESGQSATFTVPALDVAPAAETPAAPSASGPATTQPEPTAPAASEGGAWRRPTGLAIAGAGVVMVGVGAVLALTAKSSYDSAFSSGDCDKSSLTCDATGQQQVDGARSRADIGGALIGIGAAFAVGGGVLFFTAPHGQPARAGLRVTPTIGPAIGGLSIAGGF